jgi:hypothetical protein
MHNLHIPWERVVLDHLFAVKTGHKVIRQVGRIYSARPLSGVMWPEVSLRVFASPQRKVFSVPHRTAFFDLGCLKKFSRSFHRAM